MQRLFQYNFLTARLLTHFKEGMQQEGVPLCIFTVKRDGMINLNHIQVDSYANPKLPKKDTLPF